MLKLQQQNCDFSFRLLVSGGAEVIPMKIPVKNPEKVANSIGYIFVSEQKVPAVAHLLEYGVLCIKPEFIGDYLIKVKFLASHDSSINGKTCNCK